MACPSFLFSSALHFSVFSGGYGIVYIFFLSTPFEVVRPVVLWVVVLVVDDWELVRIGNECCSDKPVDGVRFRFVVFA